MEKTSLAMRLAKVPVSILAALALAGCQAKNPPGDLLDARSVTDCLREKLDNFVRNDDVLREVPSAKRPALKQAVDVIGFGPLDITFGEEIDGVITAPAPTVIAFFDSSEDAERLDEKGDERRQNALLFVGGQPTPLQGEAFDACLGEPS